MLAPRSCEYCWSWLLGWRELSRGRSAAWRGASLRNMLFLILRSLFGKGIKGTDRQFLSCTCKHTRVLTCIYRPKFFYKWAKNPSRALEGKDPLLPHPKHLNQLFVVEELCCVSSSVFHLPTTLELLAQVEDVTLKIKIMCNVCDSQPFSQGVACLSILSSSYVYFACVWLKWKPWHAERVLVVNGQCWG